MGDPCKLMITQERKLMIQFSSVAQLYLTLCDPMDCRTPGFPVHRQLLELTQTQTFKVTGAYSLMEKTTIKEKINCRS